MAIHPPDKSLKQGGPTIMERTLIPLFPKANFLPGSLWASHTTTGEGICVVLSPGFMFSLFQRHKRHFPENHVGVTARVSVSLGRAFTGSFPLLGAHGEVRARTPSGHHSPDPRRPRPHWWLVVGALGTEPGARLSLGERVDRGRPRALTRGLRAEV